MIDFSKDNWFREYLIFRKKHPHPLRSEEDQASLETPILHPDTRRHPIYFHMQPTGFTYGFPVVSPYKLPEKTIKKFTKASYRAKFVFLECLFSAMLINRKVDKDATLSEELEDLAQLVREFYLYPTKLPTDGKVSDKEISKLLRERLKLKGSWFAKEFTSINSLMFWDVYFILRYQKFAEKHPFKREQQLETIYKQWIRMKKQTVKTIIGAAHSNEQLSKQGMSLFEQFVTSPGFTPGETEELRELMKTGLQLEELKIPRLPWIGKRYLLDVCLVIVLADKKLDDMETDYLKGLVDKLGLELDDLEDALTGLGLFMLQHGHQLPFVEKKINAGSILRNVVVDKAKEFFGAVKSESVETKDMAVTFAKVLSQKLKLSDRKDMPSPAEISAALKQLKDLPKFAPFFSIVFMPVPGMVELYLLLAVSLEKLSGDKVSLLPSNFSKIIRKDNEYEDGILS